MEIMPKYSKEYIKLIKKTKIPRFDQNLLIIEATVSKLHNGYFSIDKKNLKVTQRRKVRLLKGLKKLEYTAADETHISNHA
jgi:hypothetical protein